MASTVLERSYCCRSVHQFRIALTHLPPHFKPLQGGVPVPQGDRNEHHSWNPHRPRHPNRPRHAHRAWYSHWTRHPHRPRNPHRLTGCSNAPSSLRWVTIRTECHLATSDEIDQSSKMYRTQAAAGSQGSQHGSASSVDHNLPNAPRRGGPGLKVSDHPSSSSNRSAFRALHRTQQATQFSQE